MTSVDLASNIPRHAGTPTMCANRPSAQARQALIFFENTSQHGGAPFRACVRAGGARGLFDRAHCVDDSGAYSNASPPVNSRLRAVLDTPAFCACALPSNRPSGAEMSPLLHQSIH